MQALFYGGYQIFRRTFIETGVSLQITLKKRIFRSVKRTAENDIAMLTATAVPICLSVARQFSMHSHTGQFSPSHSWSASRTKKMPARIITKDSESAVIAAAIFIIVELFVTSTGVFSVPDRFINLRIVLNCSRDTGICQTVIKGNPCKDDNSSISDSLSSKDQLFALASFQFFLFRYIRSSALFMVSSSDLSVSEV